MATMPQNISTILNPATPSGSFPPSEAYQLSIGNYVVVGSLGAFVSDLCDNLSIDYQLLFERRITFPTVLYFFSRLIVFVFVSMICFLQTFPTGSHCRAVTQKFTWVVYHLAFLSTSLLFFLRVRAVFDRNKYVVAFFFLLWLGMVGGSVATTTLGVGKIIDPIPYCIVIPYPFESLALSAPIMFTVNDTFTFLAISWKLLETPWRPADGVRNKIRFLSGNNLPAFSRSLLKDGQVYYLVSVTSNIAVMVLTPFRQVPYTTVLNCVLTNMMACRVYRHTKFRSVISATILTSQFISPPGSAGIVSHSNGNTHQDT